MDSWGSEALRRLFRETFTCERRDEVVVGRGESEGYTLPVSLVTLSPLAGLSPDQLSWVDRQVARIQTSLAMARSQQAGHDSFHHLVASCLSLLASQLAPLLDPEAPRHRLMVVSLILIACRHIEQLQALVVSLPPGPGRAAVLAMREVGHIVGQDRRLEALYAAAILRGCGDVQAAGEESTLSLLHSYLRLVQGSQGADSAFSRLTSLATELFKAHSLIIAS